MADDFVLKVSSQDQPEPESTEHARRVFDFALANLGSIVGNPVARIEKVDSRNPRFDTLLALGPTIVEIVIGGGNFLQSRTTECYAIGQDPRTN